LIGDGVVEREGVSGLARRLGYSPRQLHRLVFAELGTGPLRLALAHRVQNARALLETTDLPISDVAWAAGFGSIRQFNDRIREVYALSPTELRRKTTRAGRGGAVQAPGAIPVRLAYRPPLDLSGLLGFLGLRAIPGVETYDGHTYCRALRLPHGMGVVSIPTSGAKEARPATGKYPRPQSVDCELRLDDVRDFATAVSRVRRLLDLDADPAAVHAALRDDRVLSKSVEANPGQRVPGAVDGAEMAVRAILGQQVSVVGARALLGRLAAQLGEPLARASGSVSLAFPSAEALAAADPSSFPLPARRAQALRALASAIAEGRIAIDPGTDRDETEAGLLALPGIGPWTASYIRMRALGDPDVFLPSDFGVKKALAAMDGPVDPDTWKPWRSYATFHVWATLSTLSTPSDNQSRTKESSRP